MLKYIKHHMESIEGIQVYPIISLIVFFLFFISLFWWVLKYDNKELDLLRKIPFTKNN
tara:strand:+ start:5107 stop:5280 length:174 start_codon:yes stop_codon:yes gene_type:complete